MKKVITLIVFLSVLFFSCSDRGDSPQLIKESVSNETADLADYACYYKQIGDDKLEMHFFYPERYDPRREDPYPSVVNFCGGAWIQGQMEWSQENARYMAGLGFIGIAAQYRLADYENVSVLDLMMDAHSAVRWTRMYSEKFNIDPDRIIAMGDSAGGHLALSTALFPQFAEETEDDSISSIPNAVFTVAGAVNVNDGNFKRLLIGREKPINCSPYQNVRSGLPPIYMTQCTEDDILPFRYTEEFVEKLKEAGNTAKLYPIPGGSHLATWEDPNIRAVWEEALVGAVADLGWGLPQSL